MGWKFDEKMMGHRDVVEEALEQIPDDKDSVLDRMIFLEDLLMVMEAIASSLNNKELVVLILSLIHI